MANQSDPVAPRGPAFSPLHDDPDLLLPAAAYLRGDPRRNGWTAGRQAAFLCHLADTGVVADAARSVGMSLAGAYALRRRAEGYAFNLGWEAALLIARRIIADQLMTAAIKGEEARWVREDGVTTYTRHSAKLCITLLDRVTPVESLSEVLAVITRFDWFVQLIDDGVGATDLWHLCFDGALPRADFEARDRVRAGLQLADDSAGFAGDEDDGEAGDDKQEAMEYKSLDAPIMPARARPPDVQRPTATSRLVPSGKANDTTSRAPIALASLPSVSTCTLPTSTLASICESPPLVMLSCAAMSFCNCPRCLRRSAIPTGTSVLVASRAVHKAVIRSAAPSLVAYDSCTPPKDSNSIPATRPKPRRACHWATTVKPSSALSDASQMPSVRSGGQTSSSALGSAAASRSSSATRR